MEKKIAAAVRHEFAKWLAEAWPEFRPARDIPPLAARGWRLYRWQADNGVWFFLSLGILGQFNEFSVELLWNTTDVCPFDFLPNGDDGDIAASPKGRCQIMVRTGRGAMNRSWKVGPNPAFVPEVVVPAAIREMKSFVTPIMKAVRERYGNRNVTSGNGTA